MDLPFSTFAKYFKKLTFFTPPPFPPDQGVMNITQIRKIWVRTKWMTPKDSGFAKFGNDLSLAPK